jgi:hypothetical protein
MVLATDRCWGVGLPSRRRLVEEKDAIVEQLHETRGELHTVKCIAALIRDIGVALVIGPVCPTLDSLSCHEA